MTIGDAASVVALVVDVVALRFLIQIKNDDREMLRLAQESLEAQKEYLGLRRKWYESRTRRRDEAADVRPVDGGNQNAV